MLPFLANKSYFVMLKHVIRRWFKHVIGKTGKVQRWFFLTAEVFARKVMFGINTQRPWGLHVELCVIKFGLFTTNCNLTLYYLSPWPVFWSWKHHWHVNFKYVGVIMHAPKSARTMRKIASEWRTSTNFNIGKTNVLLKLLIVIPGRRVLRL